MLEDIPLVVAFIGSAICAVWDLKTTDIPDKVPYIMMAIGLLFWGVQSYVSGDYMLLASSAIAGLGLLGFGFLMYYFGQWGGGDAILLSAIGFLLPVAPQGFMQTFFPYPFSYTINVFIVGAAYMILYAVIIAARDKKIVSAFSHDLKASSKIISIGTLGLIGIFLAATVYMTNIFQIPLSSELVLAGVFLPAVATIGIYIVFKFAKSVENVGFKKRIPVSKLKVGDVLLESRLLEGINEKQLRKIRHSGKKFVWVKSGVPFVLAFPFALLVTLYIGDLLLVVI
ncbi:hypothetical protein EPN87_00735 [archaeon]|nr:MAG: hypothetical protein EPN87_00735 [archaeon]